MSRVFVVCQVMWIQQQVAKKRVKRGEATLFNDPKWPRMWYLVSNLLSASANGSIYNADGLAWW